MPSKYTVQVIDITKEIETIKTEDGEFTESTMVPHITQQYHFNEINHNTVLKHAVQCVYDLEAPAKMTSRDRQKYKRLVLGILKQHNAYQIETHLSDMTTWVVISISVEPE